MNRRAFLKGVAAFLALATPARAFDNPLGAGAAATAGAAGAASAAGSASAMAGAATAGSNFRAIYLDPELRDRFYLFLQNVFHLYPEDRFHQLILDLVEAHENDEEIYRALAERLGDIKPVLSELTYAVPALRVQKDEMARQTLDFLGTAAKVDGYLEIGSTGRYVSELKDRVDVRDPIYIVNDVAPSYSPVDMIERESPFKIGEFVPIGNYDPLEASRIPDKSLDVVTNFIGLHHCPTDRLEGFVASIRRVLRPGGRLLHRDHDVDGPKMDTFVALAHDVFNAGVGLTWEENHAQVRLFRSIAQWSEYFERAGFRRTDRALAQPHDPTQNLLLEFVKV